MGVQKEPKDTFLTAYEHREKLAACLLHKSFIAVVSECLCHLGAQYPVQLPDSGGFKVGWSRGKTKKGGPLMTSSYPANRDKHF